MKRFHFRLERLLKVKRHRELLAEQRQQQARLVFDAATDEVFRVERRLAEMGSGGLEALRRAAALGAWQARYEQAIALERQLAMLQVLREEARKRLEDADQARARIATEVEALRHLRQTKREEHEREVAHRAQQRLDEVGMQRWMAARGGGNLTGESLA